MCFCPGSISKLCSPECKILVQHILYRTGKENWAITDYLRVKLCRIDLKHVSLSLSAINGFCPRQHLQGAVAFAATPSRCSHFSLGRCVMALPAEIGDRIQLGLAKCNFMVGCESCWFDDEQVNKMPSYQPEAKKHQIDGLGSKTGGIYLLRRWPKQDIPCDQMAKAG